MGTQGRSIAGHFLSHSLVAYCLSCNIDGVLRRPSCALCKSKINPPPATLFHLAPRWPAWVVRGTGPPPRGETEGNLTSLYTGHAQKTIHIPVVMANLCRTNPSAILSQLPQTGRRWIFHGYLFTVVICSDPPVGLRIGWWRKLLL